MAKRERVQFRQGDVFIELIPCGLNKQPGMKPVRPEKGERFILAHGEVTGHAHAVALKEAVLPPKLAEKFEDLVIPEAKDISMFEGGNGDLFLQVKGEKGATVVHEEHDPITLPQGDYLVYTQREFDPIEERRVLD